MKIDIQIDPKILAPGIDRINVLAISYPDPNEAHAGAAPNGAIAQWQRGRIYVRISKNASIANINEGNCSCPNL